MPRVNWGELNSPARIVALGGAVPMALLFLLLSTVTVEREVTCLPESAPPWQQLDHALDCSNPPIVAVRPTADFGDVFSLRYLRDVPARHDVALTYKVAGVDQKAGERVLREGAQHLDMSHQGVVGGVTQPLLSSRYRVFHITVHFAIGVSMTGLGDAKHLVQWRRGAAEANESVDVQGDGAPSAGNTSKLERWISNLMEDDLRRMDDDSGVEELRQVLVYTTRSFALWESALRLALAALSTTILVRLVRALHVADADTQHCAEQPWVVLLLALLVGGLNDPLFALRVALRGSFALSAAAWVLFLAFVCALLLFMLLVVSSMSLPAGSTAAPFARWHAKAALVTTIWLLLVIATLVPSAARMAVAVFTVLLCVWFLWLTRVLARAVYQIFVRPGKYTPPQQLFMGCTFAYLGLTLAWLYWNAQGTESSVRYGAGRMRKLFAFPFLLLTNQYVLLLAYVYWPTHIYLFKEQGQTPSATVAMMRPPATLQP